MLISLNFKQSFQENSRVKCRKPNSTGFVYLPSHRQTISLLIRITITTCINEKKKNKKNKINKGPTLNT